MPQPTRTHWPASGEGVTYCFDEFRIDSDTRRLLRQDQEVHLSPKAFELLLLLVEGRSRAMSKADLHGKLWPATYVADTNLASLVAEVRRALGDPAETPRYVRTMHRFGYWFIGAVREPVPQANAVKAPIRYWLVWETRQIPLSEGENVLGRAPDAAVWIDAPGVSRQHARILLDGRGATLEDLGSKNGTYLGGRRLSAPTSLTDGDQIRLGPVVITFRIPPPAGSTDTVRDNG
jgi:DNA-binding winged helix-turn-helix (wHTH) protein